MMPRQVYRCPEHGEFEIEVRVRVKVPEVQPCPVIETLVTAYRKTDDYLKTRTKQCPKQCHWVPSVPNFIGGPTTGAGKG
ncbi:hypothetical protein LCGC14_1306470 [marine sediment metagenome]|uniref:Uncharacterized protein n=1 Tax=marine sediment metagenome TaxID=412755 RepID=A0A0F9N4S5_9ZZZZ